MNLDSLIAKMETDLAALRRARELERKYGDGETTTSKPVAVAPGGAAPSAKNGKWFAHLPEMLQGGSLSARQIQKKLKDAGTPTAYSTIHSWLKKAVLRGEYKKRGTAYRWIEQTSPQSSGQQETNP